MSKSLAGTLDGGELRLSPGGEWVEHEGVICCVDGSVYNLGELATELGLEGAKPETVLAAGYVRWGKALAPRLRGEFVVLVWSQERRRGLLIPDQLGIRGLFIHTRGRRLTFATEVRDVLSHLSSRPAPDPAAVANWLADHSPPGGGTLYEGISEVSWGHLVELEPDSWTVRDYWRPRYREPLEISRAEMVEEIRAHLRRAVQKRLSPGETTGVLMSGGLDSTSIAALAHEAAPEKMLAFSLIFPGYPSANESAWLEAMEAHLKIPIVRHAAAGPGLLASSIEHLRHWELPPNGWSEAWLQPLLRRAQEHGITAILDGEGGDEMFGSRFYFIADLLRQGRFVTAARFARRLPEFGGQAVSRKMAADHIWQFGIKGLPSAGAITALQRLAPMGNSIPWWASKECATLLATREHAAWRDAAGPRWWAFPALYTLTNNPHAVGLFDIMRRRARQAGLEPRHPLYDLDLLELMLQVPPEACSDGRLSRPLFREAMAGISPDSVRLRRDKVRFDQVLMDALVGHELPALRALFGDAPEIAAYVEPEALTELLERVPPRQRDPLAIWASQVLRFAAMEIWLRSQESRPLPDQFLCELASQSD